MDAISIKGNALPLEAVDDIHFGKCVPVGMFGVRDGGLQDTFQEALEGTPNVTQKVIVIPHTLHAPPAS